MQAREDRTKDRHRLRAPGIAGRALLAAMLLNWAGAAVPQAPAAPPASASPSAAPAPLDLETALREFQLQESGRPVRELISDWQAPRKIVVVVDRPERTAWLQEAMPAGVRVVGIRNEGQSRAELADADAVVLSTCRPENFQGATRLRWVHAGGAGSDQCLVLPGVGDRRVVLTNSQKVKSTGLAEMAMGYVFALSRSIDVTLENQRQHNFTAVRGRQARPIAGSTMLIVGLGGAGTEIARLAHALGMRVIATRNSSREGPDFVERVGLADELPQMIGEADVVIVCAPLTPATRNLFDAAMLARMRPHAILINWTRAEITPAGPLNAALREGRLGAAALNWATLEPLAPDNPLWTAPNLILAPWGGASGGGRDDGPAEVRNDQLRWLVVRENMRRFAAGERMFSVFDLDRGY